jgi:hypothetical protein
LSKVFTSSLNTQFINNQNDLTAFF